MSEQYIVSQLRMHQEEVGECLSKMIESLSHSLKHAHKTLQPKTADGDLFALIIGTYLQASVVLMNRTRARVDRRPSSSLRLSLTGLSDSNTLHD